MSLALNPEERISLRICEKILVHSTNEELLSKIKKANTFRNPKYESNIENGYSNFQTPSIIETYQIHGNGSLSVPRGFLSEILSLCNEFDIMPDIEDLRSESPVVFPSIKDITLHPYQTYAVEMAMLSDQGVIVSPTGSGKTLIGIEIIRIRGQKTLILAHRLDLAKQWIEVIQERFGLKAGFIGDGRWEIGEEITIAMIQTLSARGVEFKNLTNAFGLVLVDECHHLPALTFFDVIGQLSTKFIYSLSATLSRRDGLEKMIYLAIGEKIAVISKQEVEGLGATVPATVIAIKTGFKPHSVDSWHEYLKAITYDGKRNELIIKLAQQAQGAILILVDRIEHAEKLSKMMSKDGLDHVLAHGKIGKKDREGMMQRIKEAKITVGTSGLLGEGLDITCWGILIMGSPISSEIKLLQACGRIVRNHVGKEKALVYDLKDDCGFSGSSFNKRLEIYKKNKIWVEFT